MRIKKFDNWKRMEQLAFEEAMSLLKDRYIADVEIEDENGRLDFRGAYLRGHDNDNFEECLWKFAIEEAVKTNKEAEVNMKVDLFNKKIIFTIETDIGVKTYTIYRYIELKFLNKKG